MRDKTMAYSKKKIFELQHQSKKHKKKDKNKGKS